MDAATRNRIEAIGRSLDRRALEPAARLAGDAARAGRTASRSPASGRPTCMFLRLDRRDGSRDLDVGLHRHWLDPTVPFAADAGRAGAGAAGHLGDPARRRRRRSRSRPGPRPRHGSARRICRRRRSAPRSPRPFDYAAQTRAFVVTRRGAGDIGQLAAAYRALFLAAGGGGARPVHRDQPAARGARAHRAGAGGGRHPALRPACRRDGQRHAGRHLPRRGGKLPARHRRDARRRRRARPRAAPGGVREGALAAPRHPAPGTARRTCRTATRRPTTTASPGCGCARRSAG